MSYERQILLRNLLVAAEPNVLVRYDVGPRDEPAPVAADGARLYELVPRVAAGNRLYAHGHGAAARK